MSVMKTTDKGKQSSYRVNHLLLIFGAADYKHFDKELFSYLIWQVLTQRDRSIPATANLCVVFEPLKCVHRQKENPF